MYQLSSPNSNAECGIRVHLTPRSGRDEVAGWQDGVLRARVRAAPVEGRANEALCRLIAKQLGVPPSAVTVLGGATSRLKTLRVLGLSLEEVRARLGHPGGDAGS